MINPTDYYLKKQSDNSFVVEFVKTGQKQIITASNRTEAGKIARSIMKGLTPENEVYDSKGVKPKIKHLRTTRPPKTMLSFGGRPVKAVHSKQESCPYCNKPLSHDYGICPWCHVYLKPEPYNVPESMKGKKSIGHNPKKWKIKSCPRCQGDMYYDDYYEDWHCLQCGYVKNPIDTNTIGNTLGGLGILSVPLFIGAIWWLNNKYGNR